MTAPPVVATAAATVVLLRPAAAGFEVLFVERHGKAAFAGGALVFPGGRVEPGDAEIGQAFAGLAPADAAGRVAAARETFEEADILVSDGPPIARAERTAWRDRLNAGTAGYADFLAATGHRLDAERLIPFAHWVPPETVAIARRFDTLFYLAVPPAGEIASADGGETVSAHWLAPAEVIARADAGTVSLVFPTRRNVERLAQYASLDALLGATRARPLTRIQPEIVARADGHWLTIPEGCDYPVTAEPLAAVRRE